MEEEIPPVEGMFFEIRPKDQDLCDKDAADRIKQSFKELSGKDAE